MPVQWKSRALVDALGQCESVSFRLYKMLCSYATGNVCAAVILTSFLWHFFTDQDSPLVSMSISDHHDEDILHSLVRIVNFAFIRNSSEIVDVFPARATGKGC